MSTRIDAYVEIFQAELQLAEIELEALVRRLQELQAAQEHISARISARQVQLNLLQHYMKPGHSELRAAMSSEPPICPLCMARAKGRAPLKVVDDSRRHRCERCFTEFLWNVAERASVAPLVSAVKVGSV
jgi:hypothetical protein